MARGSADRILPGRNGAESIQIPLSRPARKASSSLGASPQAATAVSTPELTCVVIRAVPFSEKTKYKMRFPVDRCYPSIAKDFGRTTVVGMLILFCIPATLGYGNETNCTIPADPDLLGVGVRIGFYLQAAANIFVTAIRPGEGATLILLSNIVFSSYDVAIIHATVTGQITTGVLVCVLEFCTLDIVLVPMIMVIMMLRTHRDIDELPVS
jgi:hypothetical protein